MFTESRPITYFSLAWRVAAVELVLQRYNLSLSHSDAPRLNTKNCDKDQRDNFSELVRGCYRPFFLVVTINGYKPVHFGCQESIK